MTIALREAKLRRSLLGGWFLVAVLVAALPAVSLPQETDWLPYYPSVVRLRGKLITVTKFGKPTYGEDPEKDEKVQIAILILSTPIRVRPKRESTANNEVLTNVTFVQLIFPPEAGIDFRKHIDQEIVVAGTLAVGSRSGQFTDVVMTVKAVNPTGKPL